jgi:hypothetical protein
MSKMTEFKNDVINKLQNAKALKFVVHNIEYHDNLALFTFTLNMNYGKYKFIGNDIELENNEELMLSIFKPNFGEKLKNALIVHIQNLGDKPYINSYDDGALWRKKQLDIIQNPPDEIVQYYLEYFNGCCEEDDDLSNISFEDMKWALVQYLENLDPDNMDVESVCNYNWKEIALTSTSPRDCILNILEERWNIIHAINEPVTKLASQKLSVSRSTRGKDLIYYRDQNGSHVI